MKRLFQAIAVALLAIWVPATLHCQLESLPGLEELLSCCQHADSRTELPAPTHHEEDCATDSCVELEAGFYKLPSRAVVAPAQPLQVLACWKVSCLADVLAAASEPLPPPPTQFSPASWQFLVRTALPVRAPAFVS